jgi:hypothetical protein
MSDLTVGMTGGSQMMNIGLALREIGETTDNMTDMTIPEETTITGPDNLDKIIPGSIMPGEITSDQTVEMVNSEAILEITEMKILETIILE